MLRGRCHWSWTYVFLTTVGEVDLTPGPQCNPTDIDRPLNETTEEILQYRTDYNNRPSHAISFMSAIASTSGVSTVNLCAFYFYKLIGKLTVFLQLQEFS